MRRNLNIPSSKPFVWVYYDTVPRAVPGYIGGFGDITEARWHVDLHKRCGVRTYNLKGGPLLVEKRNAFMLFYQI